MPKIKSIPIFFVLWIAWAENDYGYKGPTRFGWSESHARRRVLKLEL